MTNLLNPVASATQWDNNEKIMADVIDSLKRLERVGSETSKTTQKLIDAAADLSGVIMAYFENCEDGFRIVDEKTEWNRVEDPRGIAIPHSVPHSVTPWRHSYLKIDGQLCFQRTGEAIYVARDREAALAFSKDVAAGLLDAITERAKEIQVEDEVGLHAMEAVQTAKGVEIRPVCHGERLSGHRKTASAGFPEIHILDSPGGALLCSIQCFHWADVSSAGKKTQLSFEGKVPVMITGGAVEYAESQ